MTAHFAAPQPSLTPAALHNRLAASHGFAGKALVNVITDLRRSLLERGRRMAGHGDSHLAWITLTSLREQRLLV